MSESVVKTVLVVGLLTFGASSASAQLSGHNLVGDFGLLSGSQPEPGLYLVAPFARYGSDTIKDRTGNPLNFAGNVVVQAFFPTAFVVTDWKLFGANYGFIASPPFINQRYESPRFDQETGMAFSDAYIVPLHLGWHTPRADVTVAYGFIAPTGRYEAGADDNRGLGMWSHEITTGVTAFFDDEKNWHAATTMFYEMHSEIEDSNTKVGDLITLEGGVGRSFMDGAGSVGLAYYAQFKATDDRLEGLLALLLPGRNKVFGLGPELTMPFFATGPWAGLVTVRYQWELGAESAFEGQMFNVSVTLARLGWGG